MIIYQLKAGTGPNDTETYSFGSAEAAREFAQELGQGEYQPGDLTWYSIEGMEYLPCHREMPEGRLYIGVHSFEFAEREEWDPNYTKPEPEVLINQESALKALDVLVKKACELMPVQDVIKLLTDDDCLDNYHLTRFFTEEQLEQAGIRMEDYDMDGDYEDF